LQRDRGNVVAIDRIGEEVQHLGDVVADRGPRELVRAWKLSHRIQPLVGDEYGIVADEFGERPHRGRAQQIVIRSRANMRRRSPYA